MARNATALLLALAAVLALVVASCYDTTLIPPADQTIFETPAPPEPRPDPPPEICADCGASDVCWDDECRSNKWVTLVTREIPGVWQLEANKLVGHVVFEDGVLKGFPGGPRELDVDIIDKDGHFDWSYTDERNVEIRIVGDFYHDEGGPMMMVWDGYIGDRPPLRSTLMQFKPGG